MADGRRPIAKLFTREQEEFLLVMANRSVDPAGLSVLGPLKAQRWKFEDKACPWPITAELWTRADKDQLMEDKNLRKNMVTDEGLTPRPLRIRH